MNTEEIKQMHDQYVMPTYAPGLTLVKGEKATVWDADGREYLDFLAGISVLNVGHCHPRVVTAVQEQAAILMHVSNLYYNEKQPQLAKVLSEKSLGGKCFFCNSGAETNEALIKLARLWGHDQRKYEIITMRMSFHGRTLATLTATGQEKIQKGFEPLPEGFIYADFNDLLSCREAVTEKTAAILIEPVQGEGGIVPATPEFMSGIRALCDEKNLLMLCDEVQCGMGRTGSWFAYQNYDVKPDAISLAKALGNGFPIGAISTSPALADVFQPGHHATTFGGTPLACAAALAVFQVIEEEGLLENAKTVGAYFKEQLQQLADRYSFIQHVRGQGLMLALVLDRPAGDLVKLLTENGLLALAAGKTALRFLPPLNIGRDEVDRAMILLNESCVTYEKTMKE